jgi:hypothetical protein
MLNGDNRWLGNIQWRKGRSTVTGQRLRSPDLVASRYRVSFANESEPLPACLSYLQVSAI